MWFWNKICDTISDIIFLIISFIVFLISPAFVIALLLNFILKELYIIRKFLVKNENV